MRSCMAILLLFICCGKVRSEPVVHKSLWRCEDRFVTEHGSFVPEWLAAISEYHIEPQVLRKINSTLEGASDWVLHIRVFDAGTSSRELCLFTWAGGGECTVHRVRLMKDAKMQSEIISQDLSKTISDVARRIDVIKGSYAYNPYGDSFFMVCKKHGDDILLLASNEYLMSDLESVIMPPNQKSHTTSCVEGDNRVEGQDMSFFDRVVFAGVAEVLFEASSDPKGFSDWYLSQNNIPRSDVEFRMFVELMKCKKESGKKEKVSDSESTPCKVRLGVTEKIPLEIAPEQTKKGGNERAKD